MGEYCSLFGFHGLKKIEIDHADAGDIVAVSGFEQLGISDTLCSSDNPQALPSLKVDEPTVTMYFQVNTSPFAGKEGKYITSQQIGDRLPTGIDPQCCPESQGHYRPGYLSGFRKRRVTFVHLA